MNKEFVPYKESQELRDLGFDEPCFGRYGTTSKKLFTNRIFKNSEELMEDGTFTNDLFAAPLFQQAFRWFREKHNTHGNVCGMYMYEFSIRNKELNGFSQKEFMSHEEAELECLRFLIKEIKKETKRKRLTEKPVYNTRMGWYQVSMMNETRTDKDGYELLSNKKDYE